jgi:hypothetical protein
MGKHNKGNLLIGLNRLMTAEMIRIHYNIPQDILDKILPDIPVVARDANGNDLYLESMVDRALHLHFLKHNAGAAAKLRKDGPAWPDQLWIGGKDYGPFTPGEMHLLEVLWGKDDVDERKIRKHVYGNDGPTPRRRHPEQALEQLVKRLRAKLFKKGAPVEIRKTKRPGYGLEAFNSP